MNCMSRAYIKLPCHSQALLTCSSPCSSSCTKHEMRGDMVSSDSTVIPSGWTHSNIFPDHYLIHAYQLSMPRVVWRAQGLVAGGLEEAGAVDLIIYQVPIWMFQVTSLTSRGRLEIAFFGVFRKRGRHAYAPGRPARPSGTPGLRQLLGHCGGSHIIPCHIDTCMHTLRIIVSLVETQYPQASVVAHVCVAAV